MGRTVGGRQKNPKLSDRKGSISLRESTVGGQQKNQSLKSEGEQRCGVAALLFFQRGLMQMKKEKALKIVTECAARYEDELNSELPHPVKGCGFR